MEECLCLSYANWLTNQLGLMRTLAMRVAGLFVLLTVSVALYPFGHRNILSTIGVVLLVFTISVVATLYSQMHRDPILSFLTDTKPNELGGEFWLKLFGFASVPVLSILALQWPQLGRLLSSWFAPLLNAVRP
jgi:hypothetical protein